MTPRRVPTLGSRISDLKVGSYVTLKVVAHRGGLRKVREATRGILLDNMTKAMRRMMPISVAEGILRPHEPVQAAKFVSEVVVIVRSQVSSLTHWKQYMKPIENFDGFMGRLSMSAYVLVVLHSTLFPMGVVQLRFYFWSPRDVSNEHK